MERMIRLIGRCFYLVNGYYSRNGPQSPDGRYGGAQTVGESGANNLLQIVEWNRGSKEKRRFTTKFFAELTPAKGWKITPTTKETFTPIMKSYVVDQQPRWIFKEYNDFYWCRYITGIS
jgi:hypothetical protein